MKSLIAAALAAVLAAAEKVSISNTSVRQDVDGNLMDTHDGNIVQWDSENGLYWYYSMGY